ncbi:hypothetical protein R3W88_027089 [Solanum pinnatisectum]|uniref:Serine-threonine/tyrosine-protein kinase catalytic domain-containing protein n=1 Tax=Solanum pinnatisectum TaxID=50273 RepID=A0AAV9LIH6_9SOLN|nr:hypothetical protein R3W88_027089 [Solanum pinnatisectum]
MLSFQKMTDVQATFVVVNKGVHPTIPNDCFPVLSEIMTYCWDANPNDRPPFSQVVRMLERADVYPWTLQKGVSYKYFCFFVASFFFVLFGFKILISSNREG